MDLPGAESAYCLQCGAAHPASVACPEWGGSARAPLPGGASAVRRGSPLLPGLRSRLSVGAFALITVVSALVLMASAASASVVQGVSRPVHRSSAAHSAPVVGGHALAAVSGYRQVASDGGIFSFGAPFEGSMGGTHLNAPIVSVAADPTTGGYWELASDGGIFSFNAPFEGSMGGTHLNAPMVDIAPYLVTVPVAPAPPVGSISSASGSSISLTGKATATNDGTTVSATGFGALTVAQFASDPVGAPTFTPAGGYFDVALSAGNSFTSATVDACNLMGGNSLQWWNATADSGVGAWQPVMPTPTYSAGPPRCLSVSLNGSSSPTLSQLTGTVFASADEALAQSNSTSATVAHGAGYSSQMTVSNGTGTMAYAETASADSTDIVVSPTGAITSGRALAVGSYAVTGTDSNGGNAGTGTWAFTLDVAVDTLTQGQPTAATVAHGAAYAGQLTTTDNEGAVSYAETTSTDSTDVVVSPTGAITAADTLPEAAAYTVSGTDADANGNVGAWTFTLIVAPVTISQTSPTTVSAENGAGYTGQLTVAYNEGAVSYAETPSPDSTDVVVSPTGAITAGAGLGATTYSVSGTDVDAAGNTGSWALALTVAPGTLVQSSPTSEAVAHGAGYAGQLAVTNNEGAVSYAQDTSIYSADVNVGPTGVITASNSLPAGLYPVTGTDSDVNGNTGTWVFSLTVNSPTTLNQGAPMSASTPYGVGYTGQLAVVNGAGTVSYAETTSADSAAVVVSTGGVITAATTLEPGTYTVSGTDSDTGLDAGTWAFTLTVSTFTLTQVTPTMTPATTHGTAYAGQLTTTNGLGAVTYAETTSADSTHVVVSTAGAVSAAATLTAGPYTVSGTDVDAAHDTGTWTFTLDVGTIDQASPTSGTATLPGSAAYTTTLHATAPVGPVSFASTVTSPSVSVSTGGVVTTTSTLPAGAYTVSGTDSDTNSDTGTWTFTLTVGTIAQSAPEAGVSAVGGSSTFTGQLATTGNAGAVTFVTTVPSTDITVSPSGLVTTSGVLPAGAYTVSGTDSDTSGDTGTWAYTLTVNP